MAPAEDRDQTKTSARRRQAIGSERPTRSRRASASELRAAASSAVDPVTPQREKPWIVLCPSGGLALGAYQAGAYAALHERDLRPQRIAGCSIGAINGAIIAGNPHDRRIERLARFWEAIAQPPLWPQAILSLGDAPYRHAAALWTRLTGHPWLFRARLPLGLQPWPVMPAGIGLYDLRLLHGILESLIDFGRLNRGDVAMSVTAVDMVSATRSASRRAAKRSARPT